MAKIDEYEKDGQAKGRYVDVGVLMENQGGEYILLNAEFCLAGILLRQSQLAFKTNKPQPMNVMLSVFEQAPPNKFAVGKRETVEPIPEDYIPF